MIFERKFDFIKSENTKILQRPKVNISEERFYKVLSTQTIEKGEHFLKSLIRFLENKYDKVNIFYFLNKIKMLLKSENWQYFNSIFSGYYGPS